MTTRSITRLTSAIDVIGVVPYLLGFHPQDSVVIINLCEGQVKLVQRIDIPPEKDLPGAVNAMVEPMKNALPDEVLLLGYETSEGQSADMLEMLTTAIRTAGVEVKYGLVVREGRWYDMTCEDPTCCPAEGRVLDMRGSQHKYAELVGEGLSPLASREAVQAVLEPIQEADLLELGDAMVTRESIAAWSKLLTVGMLEMGEVAVAAEALLVIDFRDALIAHLCPGSLPPDLIGEEAQGWIADLPMVVRSGGAERLIVFCTNLPNKFAAPALTVLASYSWHTGQGAVTRMALDRAIRCDPHYRLALLLDRMVDLGMRPTNDKYDTSGTNQGREQ